MFKVLSVFYTTCIYLLMIIPSVWFTYQAEIELKHKKREMFFLFSLMAIIPPCMFSAFRGETVGNDVLVYAVPVYKLAVNSSSFHELISLNTRFEYGYLALAYLSSHLFHSFHFMLFFTQLLIISIVYYAAYSIRERVSPWAIMLCFFSFFYVETFNIMRQGIAVAFVLLAFVELINKKPIKSVVAASIGTMFHSTAIIGYGLMIFITFFQRISNKYVRLFAIVLITGTITLFIGYWTEILALLARIGIIKARYANYIGYMQNTAYFTHLGTLNYMELSARWLGVCIPMIYRIARRTHRSLNSFEYSVFVGTLLSALIYTVVFVAFHSSYGYRVSFYLEILFIIQFARLMKKNIHVSLNKVPLGTFIMIISCLLCFLILYMWRGAHGTRPFYFQLYDF